MSSGNCADVWNPGEGFAWHKLTIFQVGTYAFISAVENVSIGTTIAPILTFSLTTKLPF